MPFPREDKLKYLLSIEVTINDENFHLHMFLAWERFRYRRKSGDQERIVDKQKLCDPMFREERPTILTIQFCDKKRPNSFVRRGTERSILVWRWSGPCNQATTASPPALDKAHLFSQPNICRG